MIRDFNNHPNILILALNMSSCFGNMAQTGNMNSKEKRAKE